MTIDAIWLDLWRTEGRAIGLRAAWELLHPEAPEGTRSCAWCARAFEPRTEGQVACSPSCRGMLAQAATYGEGARPTPSRWVRPAAQRPRTHCSGCGEHTRATYGRCCACKRGAK